MELIKVTESEISLLAETASEIWHEYWPCILSEEQINYMVEKFQSKNAILNQIKNQNYEYFFIKENEEIVGYTGISKQPNYLFLSKLYIKKDYRHNGTGKKAFEALKNKGYKRIQLTVNKYNEKTISAYKKYGFKIIDSVISDIGNGFVMDDYIMEWNAE